MSQRDLDKRTEQRGKVANCDQPAAENGVLEYLVQRFGAAGAQTIIQRRRAERRAQCAAREERMDGREWLADSVRNALRARLVSAQNAEAGPLIAQIDARAFDALGSNPRKSDAPTEVTLPKELRDGIEEAWKKSFPRGKAQEQGGILATKKDGSRKWKPGAPGGSDHFTPNLRDAAVDEKVSVAAHTHPYDKDKASSRSIEAGLSGQDLAFVVDHQSLVLARAQDVLFMVARTAEFADRVGKMSEPEREKLKTDMRGLYEEVFMDRMSDRPASEDPERKFVEANEAAIKAVCTFYGLVFYKGKGDRMLKAED